VIKANCKYGYGCAINIVIVVVLTLGSHGIVNQMDRRYLTFCHPYSSPSIKEDREIDEDRLQFS